MRTRYLLTACGLLSLFLVRCASLYPAAQLSPEEQGLYRAYSRIMTSQQLRTYLALPSVAERAVYAQQVGAYQKLNALSERDRTAVLQGYPFEGMSKQALLLLWGQPYWREGPSRDERWYYYGDAMALAMAGHYQGSGDTVMEVALEDGHIVWWQERIPSEENRSIFRRRFFHTPAD